MTVEFGTVQRATSLISIDAVQGVMSEPEIVAAAEIATVGDTAAINESTISVISEDFFFPGTSADHATEDYTVGIEWSASAVTADYLVSVEWQQNLVVDGGVWGVDWVAPISSDTLALLETTTTSVGIFGDAEMQISWTMPVLVNVVFDQEQWFARGSIGAGLQPDEWEEDRG